MKTNAKKMLFLSGLVTVMVLGSWAIQTRSGEGWFTVDEKKICEKHGRFIQIGGYESYGTCVCDPGYVGFLCNQIPPSQ